MPTLIENDLTLKKADSPWIINDDVMIPAGVTLTIEAGSEIFIGRKHYITVDGRIQAEGTVENPVRLHADSSAEADKWAGILIINTRAPSVFRHVKFENSYYGARLVHAAGTWTACSFMNVREVCSSFKSETVFKNCLIEYKSYPGRANINVFKLHKASVQMEGCSIYCPDSDYKVDAIDGDCLEKGISVGGEAEAVIDNNFITRCAIGVGVTNSAHAKVTRTTFYGNDYAVKCYERYPGRGGRTCRDRPLHYCRQLQDAFRNRREINNPLYEHPLRPATAAG